MSPSSNNAKHAFFYLIAFFALGFTAVAIGQIIFQLINHTIAETTSSYFGDYTQSVLRFAVSSLVIAAPIYYFVTRKINSELAQNSLDPDSAIRRWLTYFAIFIASAIAIGDLIFVLSSFLAGESTLKFLLKAVTIFAIVSGFGSYYFFDLKRENLQRDVKIKIFSIAFLVVASSCLVISFLLIDSPWRAREIREDEEKVSELREISWAIDDFYSRNSSLPRNLEMLIEESRIRAEVLHDPVTDEEYEFEILDLHSYQLCATFTRATSDIHDDYYYFDDNAEWDHTAGRTCFEIELFENNSTSRVK